MFSLVGTKAAWVQYSSVMSKSDFTATIQPKQPFYATMNQWWREEAKQSSFCLSWKATMENIVPSADRSRIMRAIKGKNTTPEMSVRSLLHRLGYRFRLHVKNLPGSPDIVLPKYHTVVFVHGCFWHRHPRCKRASMPASNVEFWAAKFAANTKRDKQNVKDLRKLGWKVVIVWQCELKDEDKLKRRLRARLSASLPPF